MICPGETKRSGADILLRRTVTPPSVVGSGRVSAKTGDEARLEPNREAKEPGVGNRPPKLAPLTNPAEVMIGLAAPSTIENITGLEAPPPGGGLNTVIGAIPVAAISSAEMEPMSWMPLIKFVLRLCPFQRMTEFGRKFQPVTVRGKAGPPATTLGGKIELRTGTKLAFAIAMGM